jgi:hypothetical protein
LLGIYLGDGCLFSQGRVVYRRISLDALYPGIVQQCVDALPRPEREDLVDGPAVAVDAGRVEVRGTHSTPARRRRSP